MDNAEIKRIYELYFDTEELEEFRTDTDRYFVSFFEASSRDYDSGEGIFAYPITVKSENFALTPLSSIVREYKSPFSSVISSYSPISHSPVKTFFPSLSS